MSSTTPELRESEEAVLEALAEFPEGAQIPEISDAVVRNRSLLKHHEYFADISVWLHLTELARRSLLIITVNPDGSWRFWPNQQKFVHMVDDS